MSDELLSAFGRKQREDLAAGGESAPEDDALGRPFDEDERASILDAVFDRVEAAPTVSPKSEAPPSNVIELGSRRRGAFMGSLLAVAAAATLVWWVWPGGEPELIASLPDYAFGELEGGIAQQRSAPNPTTDVAMPELKLRADSNINWVLTPAKPTQSSIAVALLGRSDAGETVFVPRLEAQVSPEGAVRLRGPLDQFVALTVGQWTLRLFIAGPSELPSDASSAIDGAGPWQNLALRVIIVPDE